jgi:hypothetical protein
MNRIFLMIFIVVLQHTGLAQKCTSQDDLSKIPGAWKLTETGEVSQSAADVVREKLVINNIKQIVRSNFTWSPLRGDIFYSSHFPSRWTTLPVAKICNVYEWEMHFLDFQCIQGKLKHNETYTWYYVDVNKTPLEFKESFFVSRLSKEGTKIDDDPETYVYTFLPSIPNASGTQYDYSEEGFSGGGGMEEYHRTSSYRVMNKKDVLPFTTMPKKEYYEKWKKYYQQQIKQKVAAIDAMADEYKKIDGGNKMIEDTKKAARADEVFVNKIDAIQNTKSAEALALPAIRGEELGEYYDKTNAKQYNWGYVIKPNLAYYNTKLPKYIPQLITLHFQNAYSVETGKDERIYSQPGFVKELQRMKVMDLLAEKLQPIIVQ